MSSKSKFALVLMESLSGSGHKFAAKRPKVAGVERLELYRFDPWVREFVIYKEKKRIKTLKK